MWEWGAPTESESHYNFFPFSFPLDFSRQKGGVLCNGLLFLLYEIKCNLLVDWWKLGYDNIFQQSTRVYKLKMYHFSSKLITINIMKLFGLFVMLKHWVTLTPMLVRIKQFGMVFSFSIPLSFRIFWVYLQQLINLMRKESLMGWLSVLFLTGWSRDFTKETNENCIAHVYGSFSFYVV